MRVGLLMCGHVDPRAQHVAGDYPDLFARLFAGHEVELVRYDVQEGQMPLTPRECDAWITSPSRSSVFEGEPWVDDVVDLVRRIVDAGQPFAGICFGHQLLAQALGGRVERSAGGWGVGVKAYQVVADRPWMRPGADRFHLVASHEDQVTQLPPGAELLAVADYCPIAMMSVGDRAFGLQPHPEFVAPLSASLLELREATIGADIVAAARATLDTPVDQALLADWIVAFFQS